MSEHPADHDAQVEAIVRVLSEHENLWGDDYTTCRCGAETVNLGGLRAHVASAIARAIPLVKGES